MRRPEYFAKPFGWQFYIVIGFFVFWAFPSVLFLLTGVKYNLEKGAVATVLFPIIAVTAIVVMFVTYRRAYKVENRILFVGQKLFRAKNEENTYSYTQNKNHKRFFYTARCSNVRNVQINIDKDELKSVAAYKKYHVTRSPIVKIEFKQPLVFKKSKLFGGIDHGNVDELYLSVTQPNKLRMGIEKNR